MHDWTLISIAMEWSSSVVTVKLLDRTSTTREIVAHGIRGISVRRDEPWGPSVSVLGYRFSEKNGGIQLQIDIQSGDSIDIEAARIDMPQEARSAG